MHPSRLVTVTEYVVVTIGATGCSRHVGQLALISPDHNTDARESKGTFTIALIIAVSPERITWSSPSSTSTINGTLIQMISLTSQSLASKAVIEYVPPAS